MNAQFGVSSDGSFGQVMSLPRPATCTFISALIGIVASSFMTVCMAVCVVGWTTLFFCTYWYLYIEVADIDRVGAIVCCRDASGTRCAAFRTNVSYVSWVGCYSVR